MPDRDPTNSSRFPLRLGVQEYTTTWNGLRVHVIDGMAEHRRLEDYGIELLRTVHVRLREGLASLDENWFQTLCAASPMGPEFDFATSRDIFGGRLGSGPLYVAWDTNLLIDYFKHGSAMWRGAPFADDSDEELLGELECLQLITALWVIRDIRFVMLREVIDDAKKRLSRERRLDRIRAFEEFANAMRLVSSMEPGDEVTRDGLLVLPPSVLESALHQVPQGLDQRMVRAAYRSGAQVFLTRDRGVLRAQDFFRPLGLFIASPGDLFENLLGAGAFNCIPNTQLAYWPLPDQQRVAHLIMSLPDYDL